MKRIFWTKKECLTCGKGFFPKSCKANKFCGLPCYWVSKKGSDGYWKGKKRPPCSIETKAKMRASNKRLWLGKKFTEAHKQKLSESSWHKRHSRELSPYWIEDRAKVKKSDRILNDPLRKEWTRNVKNRDGWKCKISNGDCSGRLEAHHICSWRDYIELRYQVTNGIALCHAHHPRKRAEEKRMVSYFTELLSVSKENFAALQSL